MKHQAIIKLALCTASALLLGGSIARAQVQTVRLGYCNGDKIGTALRPQGEEGNYNELSAAIRIPKEILSKYVGDTIYQISYANETKVGSFMTVFIKTDLESRTGGVVQTVTNHKVGWNHVTLKTPYPIKADKDIYIGYTAYPNASEINDAKILCMEYYHGGTPGADWYGLNGQWWSTKVDLIDYDFCIRAYAKGPKMPSKDIGIDRVSNYDMVRQNAITPVKLQVSNYGVDTIRSFVVEARKDGETFATKPVNNVSLNPNEMAIIDIPDMAFPQEGNNYFNVFVSQVNGGEDSDPSDNTKDSYVYCVPENAEPYPRTVLMEEFTSTANGESLLADSVYNIAVSERNDVIWVKHHQKKDEFQLPIEAPYDWFFENYNSFTPAIMLDRNVFDITEFRGPAYFVKYNEQLSSMLEASAQLPSFASLAVDASVNQDGNHVNATVNVESQVREMPRQTSLRMTVLAVEDSVALSDGSGIENGIIRKYLTGIWGDEIDLSSSKSAEKSFSFTVDPKWNVNNMRVVAFINNYDSTNPLNCPVFNSAEMRLAGLTGIHTITNHGEYAYVKLEGNRLVASYGYHILGIFDLAGRQVAENNIGKGIYIVKLSNGRSNQTLKFYVR